MKTLQLKKMSIKTIQKVSLNEFSNINLQSGTVYDDYIKRLMTFELEAEFMAANSGYKELTFESPKPSFLDWLLGRTKKFTVKLNAWDVIKNPPMMEDSIRIFSYEQ